MSITPESVLTRYRLTWSRADGTGKEQTVERFVDSADLTRPGDMDELKQVIRRMLAIAYLPTGEAQPENVHLQDVMPICNCDDPSPGNCAFAEYGGHRFYLGPAGVGGGYEAIRDRHDDSVLGVVRNTLSVEFLTLVQHRCGHQ
ncbi:hypothetical protein [Streptomyces sp. NPDC056061]|uniref:hypothetical protein n=1 Tax=Streptomyces sp. NPDC056061 TaxID=3345700 RepID=UPI0035D70D64